MSKKLNQLQKFNIQYPENYNVLLVILCLAPFIIAMAVAKFNNEILSTALFGISITIASSYFEIGYVDRSELVQKIEHKVVKLTYNHLTRAYYAQTIDNKIYKVNRKNISLRTTNFASATLITYQPAHHLTGPMITRFVNRTITHLPSFKHKLKQTELELYMPLDMQAQSGDIYYFD